MFYIAILDKSDFGIVFPDFPGCVSAGDTLEECADMAADALALHIGGMVEDGEALPEPSSLDDIMASPEYANGVALAVPTPDIDKVLRVNFSIRESDLQQIDAYIKRRGLTRSAFLARAALDAVEAPK